MALWWSRPKGPVSLPIGCFGKLPVYPDFVDLGSPGGTGSGLPDWLREGRRHFEDGLHGATEDRFPRRLAWPLRRGKALQVGLLWASRDRENRSFPFCLFVEVSIKDLCLRSMSQVPLCLQPIWRRLEEIARTSTGVAWVDLKPESGATLEDIQAALRVATVQYSALEVGTWEAFLDSLRKAHAGDLFQRLLGDRFIERYAEILWALGETAASLRSGRKSALALLLPAGRLPEDSSVRDPTADLATQASLWLLLLDRLCDAPVEQIPAMALPTDPCAAASVLVAFRDFIPQDLPVVLGARKNHEYLLDLRQARGVAGPERNLKECLKNALAEELRPDLSAMELMDLSVAAVQVQRNRLS